MNDPQTVRTMMRYKAWSNAITYGAVRGLPEGEALKPRKTNFGNMVRTLNHIYVVDRIFEAHLDGREHGYKARNTDETPALDELWENQQAIDRRFVSLADRLGAEALSETVSFRFVDGAPGAMTRGEILLHLVNHGTYHRGFVADMMNQIGVVPRASDFTVFVEAQRAVASS